MPRLALTTGYILLLIDSGRMPDLSSTCNFSSSRFRVGVYGNVEDCIVNSVSASKLCKANLPCHSFAGMFSYRGPFYMNRVIHMSSARPSRILESKPPCSRILRPGAKPKLWLSGPKALLIRFIMYPELCLPGETFFFIYGFVQVYSVEKF